MQRIQLFILKNNFVFSNIKNGNTNIIGNTLKGIKNAINAELRSTTCEYERHKLCNNLKHIHKLDDFNTSR